MFLSEWRKFPSAPCLAEKEKKLMTARASMLLKSRASLTCFRTCFLPDRANYLSAPGINNIRNCNEFQPLNGHFQGALLIHSSSVGQQN